MSMIEKNKRTGEIDLLRFVCAIILVIFHFNDNFKFGIFPRGSICVEYFFLVTGFLMARHVELRPIEKNDLGIIADDTWHFIIGKLKSFYKYYLVAILLQVILRDIMIVHRTKAQLLYKFLSGIPLFSLTFLGFSGNSLQSATSLYVGNTWYLSAMLIGILVLYPLLMRSYRFSSTVIFPLIALFGIGYIYKELGTIVVWADWAGFTYYGILRAIAEMALGASLCPLSSLLIEKGDWFIHSKKTEIKIGITLLKYACYAVLFIFAYGKLYTITFKKDFSLHAMLFCAIGILLSFSRAGWCIPDCKLTRYLAKLSMPLFIFHGFIHWSCWNFIGTTDISITLFYTMIISTIFICILLMYVTDIAFSGLKKVFDSISKPPTL